MQPKMSKVRLMLLTALMLLSLSLMGCGGGSSSSNGSNNSNPPITASYLPAKGATNVCVDTPLKLTFDSAPTLGKAGSIKVFKADGTLVDSIKLEDSTMSIGGSTTYGSLTTRVNALGWGSGQVRFVNYYPVLVNGKTATIYLHNQKLAYNTKYYVTIDAAVLTGKINGTSFSGISDATTWTFTTKATAPSGTTLRVDDDAVSDGSKADFCTVQGALDNIPKGNTAFYTVDVASGIYEEMLFMYDKDNVTIQGAGEDSTIIEYYNYDGFNSGSGDSVNGLTNSSDVPAGKTLWFCGHCVALFKESTGIVMKNLTIKNTTPNSDGKIAEALTLKDDSNSHTFVAKSCKFLGYQDTILLNGINWLYDCYISGDVDFIWGSPKVSLLENCEIYCTGDKGYVAQARCASGDLGFVFLNCNITGNNTGEYLARHGEDGKYDNVSYLNCKMDSNIDATGWFVDKANPATATSKAGWREYNNKAADGTTDWKSTTAAKTDGAAHYLSQSEYLTVFGGSATATTVDHTTILGQYSFSPKL